MAMRMLQSCKEVDIARLLGGLKGLGYVMIIYVMLTSIRLKIKHGEKWINAMGLCKH